MTEPPLDRLARAALPGQLLVGYLSPGPARPVVDLCAAPGRGYRAVTANAKSATTGPHQGKSGRIDGSGLTN
jgi:hypothetical protein